MRSAELVLVLIFTVVAICVLIAIGYEVVIGAFEAFEIATGAADAQSRPNGAFNKSGVTQDPDVGGGRPPP